MESNEPRSFLIVINDAPYGIERSYNGLRLAMTLNKRDDATVRVFFLGDGVKLCQSWTEDTRWLLQYRADGSFPGEARRGSRHLGSCLEARGIEPEDLVEGVSKGNMDLFGDWAVMADQVISF